MTTFVGYGQVPGHRQAEIMRFLANPSAANIEELDIGALEAFLKSAKAASAASGSCTADDPATTELLNSKVRRRHQTAAIRRFCIAGRKQHSVLSRDNLGRR
jgi:hypothetical protein